MIRINLLPFRAARKKENVKRQITVYALTVVLLVVGMTYYFIQLNDQLSILKEEEQRAQAELKKYDKVIKKIKQLEKTIKEIKVKLTVIKGLEKNKTGPVHLLDEISIAVPKDKLWLNSLRESGGNLTLTGTAMDNETVALFMTQLAKSEFINTVDLQSVKAKNLPQYRLRVSDFVLTCKTYAHKEPPKPKPKKGRKRGRR